MKRNKKAQKSNIKMRNTSKKIILMPIILILVLVIIVVSINLINNKKHKSGNNKKEDIIEYGGMIFNQEMNLSNINLITSGNETPIQVPVPKGYTASSVERERKVNGGFYIGRYETGNLSQNVPVTVKMNTDIANQTWYNIHIQTRQGEHRQKMLVVVQDSQQEVQSIQ